MPDGQTALTGAERKRRLNAARQRRFRQRKGARVVPLEIGEVETDALIDGGWLRAEDSDDPAAIATAIKKALRVTGLPESDVLSDPETEDMEST